MGEYFGLEKMHREELEDVETPNVVQIVGMWRSLSRISRIKQLDKIYNSRYIFHMICG